jgi:hypothetical protein
MGIPCKKDGPKHTQCAGWEHYTFPGNWVGIENEPKIITNNYFDSCFGYNYTISYMHCPLVSLSEL